MMVRNDGNNDGKDGQEYKANLGCDLFRLFHHKFSSFLVVFITLI